ncbi:plasminogen-like [Mizuhopecten yessoensis]|uniref:plasminogen-like n=1 Tax=Mizuhopecten yessoensis TaxID=6573 RepID=UPI000B45C293|nr:plasminogen-like [Mizuhopecten yessoensis]
MAPFALQRDDSPMTTNAWDYAGTCRNHTCPVTDKCVGLTSGQDVCVKFEFCSGLPAAIAKTTYTLDYSRGVPSALYSCIPGAGLVGGDKTSICDPLTNTWSSATIVCSTDLPAACGDPPPLVNTDTFIRPYNGDDYMAMYTCRNITGEAASDHCPLTKCTGIEQWTSGASVSCSNEDCYENPNYVGQVTCTKTGRTCQRWDQQVPHSHGYFTGSDINNYCRISSDTSEPWCYTTDPSVRYESCPVPKC